MSIRSSVAQWWSNRLLTGRLAVRVRPEEPFLLHVAKSVERIPHGKEEVAGSIPVGSTLRAAHP